jgi:hypothetical protein
MSKIYLDSFKIQEAQSNFVSGTRRSDEFFFLFQRIESATGVARSLRRKIHAEGMIALPVGVAEACSCWAALYAG